MATAGFLQGAILEPNSNKDNFFEERFTQGITSGVTMGSMHFLSNKISTVSGASLDGASTLNKSLTTALAGALSGTIGLKVDELISGKKLSTEEAAQSVYQAAFTGAALGGLTGANMRLHQPSDGPVELAEFVARDKNFQTGHSIFFDYLNRSSKLLKNTGISLDGPTKPGEVTNLPGYSPIEKAELVGSLYRDADPLLRRPEVVESLIKKVEAVWNEDLVSQITEYSENIARIRFEDAQSRKSGGESSEQNTQRLEDLLIKHNQVTDQFREGLECAVNEFLTEHKLPEISLELIPLSEANATYWRGRIALNLRQFESKSSMADLVISLCHELTHFRQDLLDIRLIADEFALPQHPTWAQIDLVKKEFFRHVIEAHENGKEGSETSSAEEVRKSQRDLYEDKYRLDRLVEQVLALRSQGEPKLSPSDAALAERIRQGSRDYHKDMRVEGRSEIDKQIFEINQFLGLRLVHQTAQKLNDIVIDPAKFKRTYGFSDIPFELEQLAREHLISPDRIADPDLADPRSLRPSLSQFGYYDSLYEKMKPTFERQKSTLLSSAERLLRERTRRYLGNVLERQAFPTGVLAELTYRAQAR